MIANLLTKPLAIMLAIAVVLSVPLGILASRVDTNHLNINIDVRAVVPLASPEKPAQ